MTISDDFQRLVKQAGEFMQPPVRARAVKQYRTGGDNFLDAEVLNADGDVDENWPLIQKIEVPCFMSLGEGTGVFYEIAKGTIIRVGFYDGDRHRPYLDAVIGAGKAPDGTGLSFAIIGKNSSIKVKDGVVQIGAGSVSVSGGVVNVGAGMDEFGNGGNVNVIAEAAAKIDGMDILLGGDDGDQVIKGNTWITVFMPQFLAHTHADDTPVKPSSVPTMETMLNGTLSQKVKAK